MLAWFKAFFERRYRVRLAYKSGAVLTITFTKFEVKWDGSKATRVSWSQNRLCHPRVLFVAVEDLEHVDVE